MAASEPQRPSAWKRTPLAVRLGGGVLLLVLVTAGVYFGLLKSGPSVFDKAVEACGFENSIYARVGDNGASLTLDMKGEKDSAGLTYNQEFCVLDALNLPDSVSAKMGQTSALDGRQTADWDGIHASWGYHPDYGLDVILSKP